MPADDFLGVAAEEPRDVLQVLAVIQNRNFDDAARLCGRSLPAALDDLAEQLLGARLARIVAHQQGAGAGDKFANAFDGMIGQASARSHYVFERVELDKKRARPHGADPRRRWWLR